MRGYTRMLSNFLSINWKCIQPYRCIMTTSRLSRNTNSDRPQTSAVVNDEIHQSLGGNEMDYGNRKPWVGYNPFKESVPTDWIGFLSQQVDWDYFIENQLAARKIAKLRSLQAYSKERKAVLGPDLAAASFVVFMEGKVKLYGENHWYCAQTTKVKELPKQKTWGLTVEAVDLGGSKVIYEGMENLYQPESVLYLNLSNCSLLDEWSISRLAMIPSLVSLDLSNNSYITERCLIPLQFIPNLQKLNLTGIKYFTDQPLPLIFLEELLPNCVIQTGETNDAGKSDTERNEL